MNKSEKLYWKIRKFSLRFNYFVYFDTKSYLSDQAFRKNGMEMVWFDTEYEKPDSPYIAIFCHVRKRETYKFIKSIESLKNIMILSGYPNYVNEVRHFMNQVESLKYKEEQKHVN